MTFVGMVTEAEQNKREERRGKERTKRLFGFFLLFFLNSVEMSHQNNQLIHSYLSGDAVMLLLPPVLMAVAAAAVERMLVGTACIAGTGRERLLDRTAGRWPS